VSLGPCVERDTRLISSAPSSAAEVVIENVALLTEDTETESSRAERLLRLHIDHSTIQTFDGIPQATLSTSIRFRDFASVFDTGDRSHEANIFRLGQALFDEIDLLLPPNSPDELVERISQLRRKLALSKWLENAVAPSVDSDLLKNGENRPGKVFSLLSGNKVARAVDMALEGNDMRLASLISQAGRTGEFRDEMLRQLEDWNKYDANPLVASEYRRLYALLAGIMDISPGKSGDKVLISKDLDWKRAFGLYLWFGCPFESSITEVFDEFTAALNSPHPPSEPLPPFLELPKGTNKWNLPTQPTDILYQLIRVFSDNTVSLDQVLSPRNCSASPTDLRLPWHLYLMLSRVMQKRDWIDRDDEGFSSQADRVTQGYAAQLEQGGQWTFAAFVLLHLETIEG
jgi:nuclear pore complex protein Nup98-Nup96